MITIAHNLLLKWHRTSASRGTVKLRVFSHMGSLSHQVEGLMSTQVTYAFCCFLPSPQKLNSSGLKRQGFPAAPGKKASSHLYPLL